MTQGRFSATSINQITFSLTLLLALLLAGCGGGEEDNPEQSARQATLKTCLVDVLDSATSPDEYCTLDTLPFVINETPSPSMEDIESRIYASHSWMKRRFMEFLAELPPDILELMKSITGIVITSDIRPAFVSVYSGALYLDPDYLWLTRSELETINQEEDFRLEFLRNYDFAPIERYVKEGEYVLPASDIPEARVRSEVVASFARVLYHELAHANDFFNSTRLRGASATQTPYDVAINAVPLSYQLNTYYPLESDTLKKLAGSYYYGNEVDDSIASLSTDEIAGLYETDMATHFYGYTSNAEDLATLFTEFMMFHNFGYIRDQAFIDYPENLTSCDQLIIRWGQRGRIFSDHLYARLELILQSLYPEKASEWTEALSRFAEASPVSLPLTDWCQSLDAAKGRSHSRSENTPVNLQQLLIQNPQHSHYWPGTAGVVK